MNSISNIQNTTKHIVRMKLTEERKLSLVARHSRYLMREFPNIFKSETLEKLYTPEFKYSGILPNTTYIINKKTNKPALMHIKKEKNLSYEKYTGYNILGQKLGKEKFTIEQNYTGNKYMLTGIMKSYANEKYAGTQIRMTQLKVERAMQNDINYIPLFSVPEALPFHAMMGFIPEKNNSTWIQNYDHIKKIMSHLKTQTKVPEKYIQPIINKNNNTYYLDFNRTHANATLRYLKDYITHNGKKMESYSNLSPNIDMYLSNKSFAQWKERALSQPILLKTH